MCAFVPVSSRGPARVSELRCPGAWHVTVFSRIPQRVPFLWAGGPSDLSWAPMAGPTVSCGALGPTTPVGRAGIGELGRESQVCAT